MGGLRFLRGTMNDSTQYIVLHTNRKKLQHIGYTLKVCIVYTVYPTWCMLIKTTAQATGLLHQTPNGHGS